MERRNKIKRSEIWESIYAIVKQLPRKDSIGDAPDAPSITTELEKLFQSSTGGIEREALNPDFVEVIDGIEEKVDTKKDWVCNHPEDQRHGSGYLEPEYCMKCGIELNQPPTE